MKKLISLLLALTLMLSMLVPAMAAQEDTFLYVSLGASNTNGYALHGYLDEYYYTHPKEMDVSGPGASGYLNAPANCYPAMILNVLKSRGYNAELKQMAQSSMRVEELRFLIDEDYPTDEYTRWRFYNDEKLSPTGWWAENLDRYRAEYKEYITNADLITYDMGLNNFGVYLSNQLVGKLYGNDLRHVLGDEYGDMFYAYREKLVSAVSSFIDEATLTKLNRILDTLTYALLGYIVNFDATIEIIRDWNPDADLVVYTVQNVLAGLNISIDGTVLPFGDIFGAFVNIANTYISTISPQVNEYVLANVSNNGRVTYFLDEIREYNGDPYSLSGDMIDCFNVYDRNLHINEKVAAFTSLYRDKFATEEEYQSFYNDILYTAYDAIARILSAGATIDPMPVDALLNGVDTGEVEDNIMDGIMDILGNAVSYAALSYIFPDTVSALSAPEAAEDTQADAVTDAAPEFAQEAAEEIEEAAVEEIAEETVEDGLAEPLLADVVSEYEAVEPEAVSAASGYDIDAAVAELLSDDAYRTVAAFGVRTNIGNSFFAHPNVQGCRELAAAGLNAWDNKISSHEALIDALGNAQAQIIVNAVKYGTDFSVQLFSKISGIFGLNEKDVEDLLRNLPLNAAQDMLAEYLLKKLKIEGTGDVAALDEYIKEVADSFKADAQHVHKGVLCREKAATCTTDGNRKYYSCTCGKCFSDKACKKEISKDSVVIPAKGHKLKHVAARSATLLSAGNREYYICMNCGKLYSDADAQNVTTLAQVSLPKKSILSSILRAIKR